MAPLPEIEDVYRIALNWSVANAVNVIHVHANGQTPAGIFTALAGNVTAAMFNGMPDSTGIASVDITPLDGFGATYTAATDGTSKWKGNKVGEYSPAVAACVSLHTAARGPANRGRVFLGPIAEASQNNGLQVSVDRTGMETAWNAFAAAWIGDSMEFVVASYKHATALTVTSCSVRPALATQRRRQSRYAG